MSNPTHAANLARQDVPVRRANGKYVIWDDAGNPQPAYVKPIDKQHIAALMVVGISTPYEPLTDDDGELLPGEERFVGMTCMEVIAIRYGQRAATGDMEATNMMLDRILGKPKQQTENINMTMTFNDWLEQEAKATQLTYAPQAGDTAYDIVSSVELQNHKSTLATNASLLEPPIQDSTKQSPMRSVDFI